MRTVARYVLESVVEEGKKSKWDANAIEKCVWGKNDTKGEGSRVLGYVALNIHDGSE